MLHHLDHTHTTFSHVPHFKIIKWHSWMRGTMRNIDPVWVSVSLQQFQPMEVNREVKVVDTNLLCLHICPFLVHLYEWGLITLWSFIIGFFPLACFQRWSMYLPVFIICFLLWACIQYLSHPFIHPQLYSSQYLLLWMMLLEAFVNKETSPFYNPTSWYEDLFLPHPCQHSFYLSFLLRCMFHFEK